MTSASLLTVNCRWTSMSVTSSVASSTSCGNFEVYIRRSLTTDARRTLAAVFVATWVDYCNAVLYGVLLTHVRWCYAAARLVVGAGKFDHVTAVLHDVLHRLPVPQRIRFKVALTALDCVHGYGPQ